MTVAAAPPLLIFCPFCEGALFGSSRQHPLGISTRRHFFQAELPRLSRVPDLAGLARMNATMASRPESPVAPFALMSSRGLAHLFLATGLLRWPSASHARSGGGRHWARRLAGLRLRWPIFASFRDFFFRGRLLGRFLLTARLTDIRLDAAFFACFRRAPRGLAATLGGALVISAWPPARVTVFRLLSLGKWR